MIGPAYQGVVVLGFPRSGTTLVRRLLDAHPAVHCPPETNLLRAAARFLNEAPFDGGLALGPLTGLGFSGIDEHEVEDAVRDLVFGFFRRLATASGKPLWAEKSVFDVFHLATVGRLCARHCRFVIVVRHPLDTICSVAELCRQMGMFPEELHRYVRARPAPLEALAEAWRDVTAALLEFEREHQPRCLRMRYEDLVAHPVDEAARMTAQLELEPAVDPATLIETALRQTGGIGLGDWKTYLEDRIVDRSVNRRRELSDEVTQRLAAVTGAVAETLGYPCAETPCAKAPSSLAPAEARRRYELAVMAGRMRRAENGVPPGSDDPIE